MNKKNIIKLINYLFLIYIFTNFIILSSNCYPSKNNDFIQTELNIDPSEIISKSSQSIKNLNSFYFDLSHENGFTFISNNLSLKSARGHVISSEELNIEFDGLISETSIKSGVIVKDESTYLKNPLNGNWETIPENINPINFFDPSILIPNILNDILEPKVIENTNKQYIIKGILPNKSLASIVPNPLNNGNIETLLTIRKSDFLISQAILVGKVDIMEPIDTKRIIKLSKFHEIKSISVPK